MGKVEERLKKIVEKSTGASAAILCTLDGIEIASFRKSDIDVEKMSSVFASTLAVAQEITRTLNKGVGTQVFISGEEGSIAIFKVKNILILSVVGNETMKIGYILFVVEEFIKEIEQAL